MILSSIKECEAARHLYVNIGGRHGDGVVQLGKKGFRAEPEANTVSGSHLYQFWHFDAWDNNKVTRDGSASKSVKELLANEVQTEKDVLHTILLPKWTIIDRIRVRGFDRAAKDACDDMHPMNQAPECDTSWSGLSIELYVFKEFVLGASGNPYPKKACHVGNVNFSGKEQVFLFRPKSLFNKPIAEIFDRSLDRMVDTVASIGFSVVCGSLNDAAISIQVDANMDIDYFAWACEKPRCNTSDILIEKDCGCDAY